MTSRISDSAAQSQLPQILERAVAHRDRFLVERDGEDAVLILSLADFVQTVAPPPDWLREIQTEAREQGSDQLSEIEICEEISATRRLRRELAGM